MGTNTTLLSEEQWAKACLCEICSGHLKLVTEIHMVAFWATCQVQLCQHVVVIVSTNSYESFLKNCWWNFVIIFYIKTTNTKLSYNLQDICYFRRLILRLFQTIKLSIKLLYLNFNFRLMKCRPTKSIILCVSVVLTPGLVLSSLQLLV